MREAIALALYRMSLSRDGVDILAESDLIPIMVQAVQQYQHKHQSQQLYLQQLLEGFINISFYDNGILPCIGIEFTQTLVELLNTSTLFTQSLHCLSNLAQHPAGKQECVDYKAIKASQQFLQESEKFNDETMRVASGIVMKTTIQLEGKVQAIETLIYLDLIKLYTHSNSDIRINSR